MLRHIFKLMWNKKRGNFLIFLEIFFAFIVLFLVFAFVSHNMKFYSVPLGFKSDNLWMIALPEEVTTDSAQIAQIKDNLHRDLNAHPEIESISFSSNIYPFSGSAWTSSSDENGFMLSSHIFMTDSDYAETMEMEMVEGRWFKESDNGSKYAPIVINKKLWESYFNGEPMIDSIIKFSGERKIVGIVDHYKSMGEFKKEEHCTFQFRPRTHQEVSLLNIKVKDGASSGLEEEVNGLVAGIIKSKDFIIQHLDDKRIQNSRSVWVPIIAVLSICGFLILNVALGLFGVLWYTINRRRSEIGLRRTVGASGGNITTQIITEIGLIAIASVFIGLIFTVQFPLMNIFAIETVIYYNAMMISGVLVLVLVLVCALYPGSQAAKILPAIALHEE